MKLFLSGGGSGQDSFELDKKFIESIDKTKPILYIPIAINTQKHPYPECLKWLKNNFKSFSFDNFIMWTEADLKNKTEEDFEQFGGIYIGGGNTYKLLNGLKEFGTFKILKNLANKDIPIYGGSAGAIILTKSILCAGYLDENEINLKDLSALDLTQDYDIWCHYKDEMKENLIKFKKDNNIIKILTIPEDAGLYITENQIEVVGLSHVILFDSNSEKVFNPGDIIA
ncbi:MAG: Type 1 glutamine amidotransferase-like domain-containing protein [Candidatus Paceibacterota bacterium]